VTVERWEVGAPIRFDDAKVEEANFDGEVLAYEEGRLVEFRWGPDVIRLELRPDGEGTALTLLDTLDDRGKGARDAAGWHVCLDRLEDHLAGRKPEPESGTSWSDVHLDYVARFGPEAAAIGPPEGVDG
jgi:hypothetical protein